MQVLSYRVREPVKLFLSMDVFLQDWNSSIRLWNDRKTDRLQTGVLSYADTKQYSEIATYLHALMRTPSSILRLLHIFMHLCGHQAVF